MKDKISKLQKIANGDFKKKVSDKDRHLRWNWEQSPDNEDMARYHFVIVDDRFRHEKVNRLVQNLADINYGVEKIREEEGKVEGTDFRYLFCTYDSRTAPNYLDFSGFNVKRDKDLLERKKGSVEDYVANIYSKK